MLALFSLFCASSSKSPLLPHNDSVPSPLSHGEKKKKKHHNCASGWLIPREGLYLPQRTVAEVLYLMTRNNIKLSLSVPITASQIFISFGKHVWDDRYDFKWRSGGIHGIPFASVPGETSQTDKQLINIIIL